MGSITCMYGKLGTNRRCLRLKCDCSTIIRPLLTNSVNTS